MQMPSLSQASSTLHEERCESRKVERTQSGKLVGWQVEGCASPDKIDREPAASLAIPPCPAAHVRFCALLLARFMT